VPGSRLAGLITTGELTAAGASFADIRRLVRRGVLSPMARGVYAPAAPAPAASASPATVDRADEHAVKLAACLARSGSGTVGSHQTAAVILGIALLRSETHQALSVTRPPGATGSRTGPPGVLVHAASLAGSHVTASAGVPVTTAARTVVDLARTSSFRAGVVAADSALRSKLTTKADMQSVIAACARWPGIRMARRVVAFSDTRSESVLESVARVAFHEHDLPRPDLQVWVGDEDEAIGRADFLWREYRTVGEADGAVKYADPSRAVAQLRRDARLRRAGFEVVHFSWREVCEAPQQVTDEIRGAFRRGTRR
jgi:hypothetical protein